MTHLARKLRVVDYFTLGWGTMVGVGWLVLMDDWLLRGGPGTPDLGKLIDDIKQLDPRVFVITGGDPLKREDLFETIAYAKKIGLEPSVTPSATPLLTPEAIAKMKEHGVARLNGATTRERALGLTSVAHPKFRDELESAAKKMGLV